MPRSLALHLAPDVPIPGINPEGFYQTPNIMAVKAIRGKFTAADWCLWAYVQAVDPHGDRMEELLSPKKLGEAIGLSERQVKRSLSNLEEAGVYVYEIVQLRGQNIAGAFVKQLCQKKRSAKSSDENKMAYLSAEDKSVGQETDLSAEGKSVAQETNLSSTHNKDRARVQTIQTNTNFSDSLRPEESERFENLLPEESAGRGTAEPLATLPVQPESASSEPVSDKDKRSAPETLKSNPKLDPRLGIGTESTIVQHRHRAQLKVTPNYQFSGPWKTQEEFLAFQEELYGYAKLESKVSPSGWAFTVIDSISKGIHSPLWDDFKAGRPLGSTDKEGLDYLDETGNPHEYFLEDRVQYYVAKGEPVTAATQKASKDLSNPSIAKPLWSGFLRKTDREADSALAASKLGVAIPVLSPCFTPREKATKESVAAKLDVIASSTTLPPAQNSASCPVPEVRSDQLTEDQKFQALLQGMRGHIKSGQPGRVRLATQWADMNSLHVRKIYNSTREVVDLEEAEF